MKMSYILRKSQGIRGMVLVHENYTYEKNKKAGSKIYWRCQKVSCRVGLHTNDFVNDDDLVILHAPQPHHHTHEAVHNDIVRIKNYEDLRI